MSILIVGGDSAIARATLAVLREHGMPATTTTRRRGSASGRRSFLDLAEPLGDWQPPAGTTVAGIFAAVGNLADCARDPAGSERVNVAGTIALVERLVAYGVYVLYLSTDKVFDGSRAQMPADAALNPRSTYGRQKAQTDAYLQAMIAAGAPVGILRLARIAPPGWPLLRQWRDDLAIGRTVHPFDDMMAAPTAASHAAAAIVALLQARATGVWQLSGTRDLSYTEIAHGIAQRSGADPRLVEPMIAAAVGMPEGAMPRHTTLDCSALEARFGIRPQDPWRVIEAELGLC